MHLRAPEPFSHLVASPVFNPDWGWGWLGYDPTNSKQLIYVPNDLTRQVAVGHEEIYKFIDRSNSHIWLLFRDGSQCYAFLLGPVEAVVVVMPVGLEEIIESWRTKRRPLS